MPHQVTSAPTPATEEQHYCPSPARCSVQHDLTGCVCLVGSVCFVCLCVCVEGGVFVCFFVYFVLFCYVVALLILCYFVLLVLLCVCVCVGFFVCLFCFVFESLLHKTQLVWSLARDDERNQRP